MHGQGEDRLQEWSPSSGGDHSVGIGRGAVHRRSLAAPSGGEKQACLAPEVFRRPSRARWHPFPAHLAGETGPTVCGYMGLDGASGSAAETQKLNFEEQPDSRVRVHRRGPSPSLALPWGRVLIYAPAEAKRQLGRGAGNPKFCMEGAPESLHHAASCHVRRGGCQTAGGGRLLPRRTAEWSRPHPLNLVGVRLRQDPVHLRRGQEEALPAGAAAGAPRRSGAGHLPQPPHQGHLEAVAEEAVTEKHRP